MTNKELTLTISGSSDYYHLKVNGEDTFTGYCFKGLIRAIIKILTGWCQDGSE